MDYERGLVELRRYLKGTRWYAEFLLYEARLRENLASERLYGSNETVRAGRGPIVEGLNRLATEAEMDMNFNDLCLGRVPDTQTSASGSSPVKAQPSITPTQRNSAFISYSSKDKKYLDELQRYLAPYKRKEELNIWDDTRIPAGARWKDEIGCALLSAKVAVFLVSVHFLASEFIARKEIPPLLKAAEEEGTCILCVILGHCAIKDSELAQFQMVNVSSRPVSRMGAAEKEKFWSDVAKLIVNELKK